MSLNPEFNGLLSPEATKKEQAYFDSLYVPTHPEYDFDRDPSEQFEYANPVTLNNQLVLYTNAALSLSQRVVTLGRRRQALRLEQKALERQLKDIRTKVLAKHPAPPSAAKNLALTEAYVRRCLETEGLLSFAQELEQQLAVLEDKIDTIAEERENLFFNMNTIKLASTNLMTHLSYVKQEARMMGQGNHA